MPTFQPPTVADVPTVLPDDEHGPAYLLFRHYGPRTRGRTVLKIAGVYTTVDNPHMDLVATAAEVYVGGHVYEVTQTVADALTAAGYTVS